MQDLFSLTETGQICGVNPKTIIVYRRKGILPEPSETDGMRKFYTAFQVAMLKEFFSKPLAQVRLEAGEISVGVAAERLKVCHRTLYNLMVSGVVLAPQKAGRRRYYRPEDLPVLKDQLKAHESLTLPTHRAVASGYFSISKASEKLGMPLITLRAWIGKGAVDRPAHRVQNMREPCFSLQDLRKIRESNQEYFVKRGL
ncbi:helix-turn-helix domain-containing protein [Zavarzinella formosa]|uniref:helix-turn-helix domain-containing protein n=1 Tax=Zavarzinella formosa TaxID=360055 RepID=UPI0002FDCF45|nr:helix-turn-helix domain-containing protein [Zavarzinella formosa]